MTTRALIGVALGAAVIGIAIVISGSARPLWAIVVLPFIADSL